MYANVMVDQPEKTYNEFDSKTKDGGEEKEKEKEEEEEERSVRSILISFAESTTMHGVARVGSPGHRRYARLFWLLLVLSFFGWATYNVTLILMNFSSYPISTLVTVKYEDKLSFPAITICNLNMLLHSQLQENEKLKPLRVEIEEVFQVDVDIEYLTPSPPSFVGDVDVIEHFISNASLPVDVNVGDPAAFLGGGGTGAGAGAGDLLPAANPPSDVDPANLPSLGGGGGGGGGVGGGFGDVSAAADSSGSANAGGRRSSRRARDVGSTTVTERSTVSTTPPKTSTSPTPESTTTPVTSTPATTPPVTSTPATTPPVTSTPATTPPVTSTSASYDEADAWFTFYDDPDYVDSYADYSWHDGTVEELPDHDLIEQNEESKASIRTFMDRLDPKERFQYGHQMRTMLLDCQYQTGTSCTHKNFTRFYNHYFGNCYTFNKNEDVASVSKSGPLYGLTLLLNVQSEEYMQQSDTVGFKVLVHPQDAMPFPEDEGIIISPGFATNIAIKKQDFQRSPPPYEKCKYYSKEQNRLLNMYALPPYKVNYTEKACQRTCYQKNVVKRCGCCDADYPCKERSPAIPGENVTFCNSIGQLMCAKRVQNDMQNSSLSCLEQCLPNCAETTYSGQVSMGVWPPEVAVPGLKKRFRKNPELANFTDVTDFRKNIAKLNIYFKHLNYEKFETFPSYDWYRLLSDLGGQLGLWLGVSLLTAVEFLELLCLVLAHVFRKAHRTGHLLGRRLVNNGPGNPSHV